MELPTTEEIKKALDETFPQFDAQLKQELELIPRCVDTWGITVQLDVVVEELAELIQAVQKLKRYSDNPDKLRSVIVYVAEETVDVELMIKQLGYIMLLITNNLTRVKIEPGINYNEMIAKIRIGKYEQLFERLNEANDEREKTVS